MWREGWFGGGGVNDVPHESSPSDETRLPQGKQCLASPDTSPVARTARQSKHSRGGRGGRREVTGRGGAPGEADEVAQGGEGGPGARQRHEAEPERHLHRRQRPSRPLRAPHRQVRLVNTVRCRLSLREITRSTVLEYKS